MEQPFTLTTELRDARLIISTSGYVNNVGGEAIANAFQPHFAAGVRDVIVNLADSKVVNSVGMSFLIEILERLSESGGRLIFTNLDPAVEKMLSIMGLFGYAGRENTVEEALHALSSQS